MIKDNLLMFWCVNTEMGLTERMNGRPDQCLFLIFISNKVCFSVLNLYLVSNQPYNLLPFIQNPEVEQR